jgi:hypothetical protein
LFIVAPETPWESSAARGDYCGVTTAATYAEFAAREARDVSPSYERLSLAVSRDGELLALLGTLPLAKRTPLAWTRSHGQEIIWFG